MLSYSFSKFLLSLGLIKKKFVYRDQNFVNKIIIYDSDSDKDVLMEPWEYIQWIGSTVCISMVEGLW